ncbi:S-adenosylmethionine mitochondrial carrier protein homolog [Coccinella septempunctata]|uniref:S-adenosylmethionine mitochondrial carrier protein homolog n=1 Tax=Coccinella septempunctata TaxID=41139 RepID=UPI001D07BA35|nr:S-adenosylmethionine mitochondrial carrier protein homolog [Coccinella septempunctata]
MESKTKRKNEVKQVYVSSFVAGGFAGFVVDMSLFPLDTLKTRLQSPQGFIKAGGFRNVYKGVGPQMIGSVPQGALFFLTYESIKYYCDPYVSNNTRPLLHMFAASAGEVVACILRVPMEVVKQRRQTATNKKHTSLHIVIKTYKRDGFMGFYQGFRSMVYREIPFSFIQFPLLEYFKMSYRKIIKNNIPLEPHEVALCGSLAGGIAAAATTPLDVVKTRIMLETKKLEGKKSLDISNVFMTVLREKGFKGIFAGFGPRVAWISLGGYIFFGTYDLGRRLSNTYILNVDPDPPL